MIIVPNDVKCDFCTKIFCCSTCRQKHEENFHKMEIEDRKHEEHIKNCCYLCNGQQLPLQDLTNEILQHIASIHLPLKCNKCSRIFETVKELSEVRKCCRTIEKTAAELTEIQEGNTVEQQSEVKNDKPLTPLTKINLRWRRKSRDFGKTDPQNMDQTQSGGVVRQTSTPMQLTTAAVANFTDSSSCNGSSIQISSINCISSCSSELDEFSPPLSAPKHKGLPTITPKPAPNRSRPKLPVQATPLRQVMSKSIQKAIAEHGHYRHSPYVIQQRKMSFNSTNSSSECSLSFMKVPGGDSPLDLRLSPAIRRVDEKPAQKYQHETGDLINFDSMIEDKSSVATSCFEVYFRRSEIKSDSSAMTSYKSVFSDTGRSGSMPELHITPKMIGNNFMKKTISFETPEIENTPGFLMPTGEVDDDDVFYTPRTSPVRVPLKRRASADTVIPIEDEASGNNNFKPRNIWNIVSVLGETLSDNLKFNFKQPGFVKLAADYFSKRSSEPDEFSHKRRRTSSSSSGDVNPGTPANKRQKIQGRKPIRMTRHSSLN